MKAVVSAEMLGYLVRLFNILGQFSNQRNRFQYFNKFLAETFQSWWSSSF